MAFPRCDPQVDLPRGNSLSNPTPPGLRPPPPPGGGGSAWGYPVEIPILELLWRRFPRENSWGSGDIPDLVLPRVCPCTVDRGGSSPQGEGPTGRGACLPPLSHWVAILVTPPPALRAPPPILAGSGAVHGDMCDRPKAGARSITEGSQAGGNPCLGQVSACQRCE